MKISILFASALLVTLATAMAAQAQGVPGGISYGAYEGQRRAGPVGAVVGGAVGGVIGGVEGVFGVGPRYYYDERPVYRTRVSPRVKRYRYSRAKRYVRYRRAARY